MVAPVVEYCKEEQSDHPVIVALVREAFWNLYMPGCDEHVVLLKLWQSDDYLPDLSLVAKLPDGKIVGYIAYSKSSIISSSGQGTEVVTFGPVAISPDHQGKGYGKTLINKSIQLCKEQGHKAIVILGYPTLYSQFGFRNGREFGVSDESGGAAKGLQVLELEQGYLDHVQGRHVCSMAFTVSPEEIEEVGKNLPVKEKFKTKSQEMFQIVVTLEAEDSYPSEFDPKLCNDRRRIE